MKRTNIVKATSKPAIGSTQEIVIELAAQYDRNEFTEFHMLGFLRGKGLYPATKLKCVKVVKDFYAIGLKEAKAMVDSWATKPQ